MSGGLLSQSQEIQKEREDFIKANEALRAIRLEEARIKEENPFPSEKVQEELAELEQQKEMFQNMQKGFEKATTSREGKAEGGKFPDLTGDGEVTQADVLKGRGVFAEGSEVKPAFSTVGMAPNTPKSGSNMSDELRKYIELQRLGS